VSVSADAQAPRTWVSGVGDDVNPCSRTAPCKTFAGAISKTADHGEISVLDPGGFGAVTITKSISIQTDGGSGEGSILAALVNGIIINSASAVVNLSGLTLEGANTGLSGIRILQASNVHIRNCQIRGFKGGGAQAFGIEVFTSVATRVVINNCTLSKNIRGVLAHTNGAGGSVKMTLDRVVIDNHNGIGLRSQTGASEVWVSNSTFSNNAQAIQSSSGGTLHSFGNNIFTNNTTDGTFTDTVAPK
jgi:pectate lyase